MNPAAWQEMKKRAQREQREREREGFSLFTSTFRYSESHAFSNVCKTHLAAHFVSDTETHATTISAGRILIFDV
jgi:hypothetical protein